MRISPLLAAFLLASLIANVSLFLFPYDWKREQSPPGEYRSQQPNGQQSETEQRAPATRIQVECDPECSAKRSYESGVEPWLKKYLQKVRDDPVGGFTGLLFVATLLLAHIAARQVKDSRAIQRAHVFVLSPGYRFNFDNHGAIVGMRLWVILKNSGTTPASNMTVLTGATWATNIEDFVFGQPSEGAREIVLGPAAEIAGGGSDISPAHTLGNFNRQGHQFLWGIVRYRDIFYRSREHVLEFCFRATTEVNLGPPPFTGGVAFAPHGEHNRYYDA
jgi:hypothetical protein